MATTQSPLQNELALVSSLYGPGTITCWYLTTLSVLVSWTLHPRKRKLGSIDVDLIAVLTLPAVAAGHSVSQVREFLNQNRIVLVSSSADWKYRQSVAAIEASLNVTETFMAISVILFIVATWMFCIRRAIFVALIGLLCFTVESYIHFSKFMDFGLRYRPGVSAGDYITFTRSFVADFASLVTAILVTLSVCGLFSTAIAIFMLSASRTPHSNSRQDAERHSAAEVTPSADTTRATLIITMMTTLFLPVALVSSSLPPIWYSIDYHAVKTATTSYWQTLREYTSRLVRVFFPRTACSITDLDQVVAAAAGATVLGFGFYSVAKAHYKLWNSRSTTARSGSELSRIENDPAS